MSFTFTSDAATRTLRSRATGRVNLADLLAFMEERVRQGLLDYDHLLDMRGVDIDLGYHEAGAFAAACRRLHATRSVGITAVVADSDVTYGVARMIEMLLEFDGIVVAVFREQDAADTWLRGCRSVRTTLAEGSAGESGGTVPVPASAPEAQPTPAAWALRATA